MPSRWKESLERGCKAQEGLLCALQTDHMLLVLGNGVTSHGGEHQVSASASTRSIGTGLCTGTPLVMGGEEYRYPGVDLKRVEPSESRFRGQPSWANVAARRKITHVAGRCSSGPGLPTLLALENCSLKRPGGAGPAKQVVDGEKSSPPQPQ